MKIFNRKKKESREFVSDEYSYQPKEGQGSYDGDPMGTSDYKDHQGEETSFQETSYQEDAYEDSFADPAFQEEALKGDKGDSASTIDLNREFRYSQEDAQEAWAELPLEERYEANFNYERKILLRNIRRVAALMLLMFVGLMSYLVYFQVTKGEELASASGNRRNAEQRNKVLRGDIYDRKGRILAHSELQEDGSQSRSYPAGEAFGNILGYVSDKYSVTGLERSMDKVLSKGPDVVEVFNKEFLLSLIHPENGVTGKKVGHSVQVTLDEKLQKVAYEALDGKKGSVVAIKPSTGEILAMVSSPGFAANDLDKVMGKVSEDQDFADSAPLINRAIHSTYSPGSTMKVVTLASALTNLEGVKDRTFHDTGAISFPDGTVIPNFKNNVYGDISLSEGFTLSSNFVFGNLGMELTNNQLKETAQAFGFNKELTMTGLSPKKSSFPDLGENQKGEKALTAIGQGQVEATPIQMAMVASAVANKGSLLDPFIVSAITNKDGQVVSETKTKAHQALTAQVAEDTKLMMQDNIRNGGTAYQSLQGVQAAGKTGTGQYSTAKGNRVNAWFVGFAPVENPEIALAVVLEDLPDDNANTGAVRAIPVAKTILEYWGN